MLQDNVDLISKKIEFQLADVLIVKHDFSFIRYSKAEKYLVE